jgi:hypothetical protein
MNNSQRRLILAYEKGYRCDSEGNVLSKRGNILKTRPDSNGYLIFLIRIPRRLGEEIGKSRSVPVHRLQAYQKFGDKIFEKGIHVRHLNSNEKDNSDINISIGTPSENMMDKPKKIRIRTAINAAKSVRKFDDVTVSEIKQMYKETKSYKKVMEKYKISSKGTLHHMLNKEYVTVLDT